MEQDNIMGSITIPFLNVINPTFLAGLICRTYLMSGKFTRMLNPDVAITIQTWETEFVLWLCWRMVYFHQLVFFYALLSRNNTLWGTDVLLFDQINQPSQVFKLICHVMIVGNTVNIMSLFGLFPKLLRTGKTSFPPSKLATACFCPCFNTTPWRQQQQQPDQCKV